MVTLVDDVQPQVMVVTLKNLHAVTHHHCIHATKSVMHFHRVIVGDIHHITHIERLMLGIIRHMVVAVGVTRVQCQVNGP